ncbi:hypothetical protein ACHAC9_08690 [Massilia sp. CMS3.1]|uniref:hypothetical protein n=1 Tax=Massilia sp. CMS3.1 TaxID=3373083 RepID=UPI003EE57536
MRPAWFLFALAAAAEAAGLLLLDAGRAAPPRLLAWAALHIAAAAAGAALLAGALPARLRHARGHAVVLAFLFSVCIPFFGMLGVALVLLTLARQPCPGAAVGIDLYRPSDEPRGCNLAGEPGRRFAGAGGLINVVKHGSDRHDRLCALIATQSLDDRCAAPVLQVGVRDGDDDVRLLAYSLLMKKQKVLENRLTHGQRALDSAAAPQRFPLHLAMAHHFWDMQQLTPDSAAATLWVEQASRHVDAGLEIQPANADLLMLSGMMALRAGQSDRADDAFEAAAEAGIAATTLAPYRAESEFYRRGSPIPSHLTSFPEMSSHAAA